ncbi:MAG: F0F1 ATP synthase subunit B [Parvularcula sp.]|jgi:F-type H+-transporting ATPase subunit b|nr:F0F1 ATP synthase subunit B [Parvularcula sp.]
MMFAIQDNDTAGELIGEANREMLENDGREEIHAADEYHEEYGLLEDTNLWVLLGFIAIIVIILSQGVGKKLSGFVAGRATLIQQQLDEARSLREDAQRILADYQKRQREAETEAEDIISQAKADAKAMVAETRRKIDDQTARRTEAAQDRIARAEAQAVAAVRAQTADLAVDAAREIIKARTDGAAQRSLLDRSIKDIRGKLN